MNRYTYVRNNPLRLVGPSGNAECAAGDTACWVNEWEWKNRWYEAHGWFAESGGWTRPGDAHFQDAGILGDTMAELGIQFFSSRDASWTPSEMTLVAQAAVALANKIGSFALLRNLLPNGASFLRAAHALFYYLDPANDPPAHTFPGSNLVVFADSLFTGAADYVRGTAVHELAHVIDYFNPFAGGVYIHQVVPTGTHISDYAVQNNLHLEYWAEMVTDWVYGSRYNGPYTSAAMPNTGRHALTTDQARWIEHVLTGWGW